MASARVEEVLFENTIHRVKDWLTPLEPEHPQMVAPPRPPVCVLAGIDTGDLEVIRSFLDKYGVDVIEMDYAPQAARPDAGRNPNVVFLGPGRGNPDVSSILSHVATPGFDGAFQLIGDVPDGIRIPVEQHVEQHGSRVLPHMDQPVTDEALTEVVMSEGLSQSSTGVVEVGLKSAIRNKWIEFWYEPQINLAAYMLHGAEARVRVRHPRHGVLFPRSFLPTADRKSMIVLGRSALRASLRDWTAFLRLGFNLRIAINLPIECLMVRNPEAILDSVKWPTGLWPGMTIEVKEAALSDHWDAVRYFGLHAQRRKLSLSIDKFGEGSASIARLGGLSFEEVKIAENLANGCRNSAEQTAICQTVVDLAHRLKKRVTAVGIANVDDLRVLKQMGCDFAQGPLFSKPLPREQFALLLRQKATFS